MAANVIDIEIQKYLHFLGPEEKKSILHVIKSFVQLRQENASQRVSIEQYNKEIDEALGQFKSGDSLTQQELEKEMEKW